ncbi:uncharacterized protein LOC126272424 isoform X2 [Schistocerca gregaria]|uniref:uncharacterized protein LOC126272424 isoform X2 n=2 Tax=Schistocerca gregaria TaxID=7010 RepID=UPI00211E6074|nr:uncharacterized protein LOC126272424 isoform X2 [Schistocerca gregaria]
MICMCEKFFAMKGAQCTLMAAPADDGNEEQQQGVVTGGAEFPGDQLPPNAGGDSRSRSTFHFNATSYIYILERFRRVYQWRQQAAGSSQQAAASVREEQRTPARRRDPAPTTLQLCRRALLLGRCVVARLLRWFSARPLGQRALQAVSDTMMAAERATVWAGSATAGSADRQPVPFTWCAMMPVVVALMVIQTGSALAERYLNVQLPGNRQLVSWLQRQRVELEQLKASAACNIRTHCIDESDPMHRLLNTWPLNIPYRAAQQLGIIPVRVDKQPSDTESTSIPPLEVVASSSASDSSTLTEDQENTAPSSREVTPPPKALGEKSMYFSPEGDRQTEEETEPEEPQNDKQEREEAQGEKAQEEKAELPTITAEEAEGAARTVVQPQPPASVLSAEEAERAAMDVVSPLPPPQPAVPAVSSEQLLAAEGASCSEPGTSTRELKASSKALKSAFFRNLF